MDAKHLEIYTQIQSQYQRSAHDSSVLLRTILQLGGEIGFGQALALLSRAVTEKRLAWLQKNLERALLTDDPLQEGYHWFYERYLGLSIPADGEIIRHTPKEIVMRWWNRCPTLEACRELGLDTRQVCKLAYHQPVQAFLEQIHPDLVFKRNYAALRPYAPYCEEIISLK